MIEILSRFRVCLMSQLLERFLQDMSSLCIELPVSPSETLAQLDDEYALLLPSTYDGTYAGAGNVMRERDSRCMVAISRTLPLALVTRRGCRCLPVEVLSDPEWMTVDKGLLSLVPRIISHI